MAENQESNPHDRFFKDEMIRKDPHLSPPVIFRDKVIPLGVGDNSLNGGLKVGEETFPKLGAAFAIVIANGAVNVSLEKAVVDYLHNR